MGMKCYEEALDTFIQGLKLDPESITLSRHMAEATEAIRTHNVPSVLMVHLHTQEQLLLLSPRDFPTNKTVHTLQKYMKTLSDLAMPRKLLDMLEDRRYIHFMQQEICSAVAKVKNSLNSDDLLLLQLGTTTGVFAMTAARSSPRLQPRVYLCLGKEQK